MHKPTMERPHPGAGADGTQKIYRFKNNYGASVVQFNIANVFGCRPLGSYGIEDGLWELAVIKFTGTDILNFELCYDTPITDDVIGYLDDAAIQSLLTRIEVLDEQKEG